jgi:hypothetical protein
MLWKAKVITQKETQKMKIVNNKEDKKMVRT